MVSLPNALMQQARLAKDHAPRSKLPCHGAASPPRSRLRLSRPSAFAISVCIELSKNLIKPGGLSTPYWLVFPNYDVKNRVDLNFKFDRAPDRSH